MMGALKGELFPTKILNKNSLSLAHCALNRSFTVYVHGISLDILKDCAVTKLLCDVILHVKKVLFSYNVWSLFLVFIGKNCLVFI